MWKWVKEKVGDGADPENGSCQIISPVLCITDEIERQVRAID